MPKKKEIKLDPKMLDGENVPYPCTGCSYNKKQCAYKYCTPWRKWFRSRWKEVTNALMRKE